MLHKDPSTQVNRCITATLQHTSSVQGVPKHTAATAQMVLTKGYNDAILWLYSHWSCEQDRGRRALLLLGPRCCTSVLRPARRTHVVLAPLAASMLGGLLWKFARSFREPARLLLGSGSTRTAKIA